MIGDSPSSRGSRRTPRLSVSPRPKLGRTPNLIWVNELARCVVKPAFRANQRNLDMRVLFVASEAYPLAKTGGLGDVGRALPTALVRLGADARLLMPGYPQALDCLLGARIEATLDGVMGVPSGRLISGRLPDSGVPTWLIDAPSLYQRPGGPYVDADGVEWADNALRFAYLSHVGALIGLGLAAYWKADVVHANDWHTGLVPLKLALEGRRRPATVFTIHNLAYQGNFPMDQARALGLPDSSLTPEGLEFYGHASFLKAGIRYADRVTTVSPTYAREVLSPEFGFGMEGVLKARGRDFRGILNGVEEGLWSPGSDPYLCTPFGPSDISGKLACKAEIQRELGLTVDPSIPLVGFVSRLAHQKMADVLLQALPFFGQRGAQFALISQGEPGLETAFAEAARNLGGDVAIRIGYEEPVAHRLYAGADMLLAPARFEPCGLTQLYAMRYGSLPIVRRTGGLADTVINADRRSIAARTATGFTFDEPSLNAMTGALDRALKLYRQPLAWRRLLLQAMAKDFSWEASAAQYLSLYRAAAGIAAPAAPETAEVEAESVAV